jgi:hypothetical protein
MACKALFLALAITAALLVNDIESKPGDTNGMSGLGENEAQDLKKTPESIVCFSEFLKNIFKSKKQDGDSSISQEVRRQMAAKGLEEAKKNQNYWQHTRILVDAGLSISEDLEKTHGFSGPKGMSRYLRTLYSYPNAQDQILKTLAALREEGETVPEMSGSDLDNVDTSIPCSD